MLRAAPALVMLLLAASGAADAATRIQISVGSIEHPALPASVQDLHLDCRLEHSASRASCSDGEARVRLQDQPVALHFDAALQRNGSWHLATRGTARGFTWSDPSGRHATDKLDLDLVARIDGDGRHIRAQVNTALPRGQAYVEPVFVDFGLMPATLQAKLDFDTRRTALVVEHFDLQQPGVVEASGELRWTGANPATTTLDIAALQLGPAFATYVQPFFAGTPLESTTLSGTARGRVQSTGVQPQRIALVLDGVGIESGAYQSGVRGFEGEFHWTAQGEGEASRLHWAGAHVAKLEIGAAELRFRSAARDLELLAPLRLPLAGGALNVRELAVQRAGQADAAARFDATIEPIDLAALCRAFGWPEFGGQLGGRLPGLSLQKGELKLDGALTAKAFDGDIALDDLRVLEPFGRVPRVEADIRLRNLDLAAITSAFSFGRIEGRIDGDVDDLRLIDWQPVSFRARLATPPGDRSRHRISQRAIDNISAVGGGPTGVLQRGALRFFDDFAYDRIGWSCVLSAGVCHMAGIEPTGDGGYVLVEGRLLPRIDVVGYTREVDWNTFVSQLASARGEGIQIR